MPAKLEQLAGDALGRRITRGVLFLLAPRRKKTQGNVAGRKKKKKKKEGKGGGQANLSQFKSKRRPP